MWLWRHSWCLALFYPENGAQCPRILRFDQTTCEIALNKDSTLIKNPSAIDLNQVSKIMSTPNEAFARPYANGILVTSQLPFFNMWGWLSQCWWWGLANIGNLELPRTTRLETITWLYGSGSSKHQFLVLRVRRMKLKARNLVGLFNHVQSIIWFLWWPSTKQMRRKTLHEGNLW